MVKALKRKIKMKVFGKGQVVIPVSLREEYDIEVGDQIEVIATEEGILLKSVPSGRGSKSLTDHLFGIFNRYASDRNSLKENHIDEATKREFIEGWRK